MKGDDLPPLDHVLHLCTFRRLIWEEDPESQQQIAVRAHPDAFRPRPADDGISITWVEHFEGTPDDQRRQAIQAIGRTMQVNRRTNRFAQLVVGEAISTAAQIGTAIRVVHDPIDAPAGKENPAHALIKGVGPEDSDLQNRLAMAAVLIQE